MAAYLGTTVESVSRSIQYVARNRVIEIVDPQHFNVIDPSRLVALSGHEHEEFDMLRKQTHRLDEVLTRLNAQAA